MKVRRIAFSSGVLALVMLASSALAGFRTPAKTASSPLYFDIGSTHIVTIASGDFDGDGWSDIVVSGDNTLVVLLNDGVW